MQPRRAARKAVLVAAAWAATAVAGATPARESPGAVPAPGRHSAELCVATGAAEPNCGPAQLDLKRDGSARIRVDDLVYQLQLRAGQADVVLMHGSVEIDQLIVPYAWVGRTLRFADDERHVRYEVRVLK